MVRKTMATGTNKAFPVKSITVDTFDKSLNGIKEESIGFKDPILLTLDMEGVTYSDMLRELAYRLVELETIKPDKSAVSLHIKTNTYKKISLSCLVKLKGAKRANTRTKSTKNKVRGKSKRTLRKTV